MVCARDDDPKTTSKIVRGVIWNASTEREIPGDRSVDSLSEGRLEPVHFNFSYSAFAWLRIGTSGSASFQRARKS
jgi:hypothetical protein